MDPQRCRQPTLSELWSRNTRPSQRNRKAPPVEQDPDFTTVCAVRSKKRTLVELKSTFKYTSIFEHLKAQETPPKASEAEAQPLDPPSQHLMFTPTYHREKEYVANRLAQALSLSHIISTVLSFILFVRFFTFQRTSAVFGIASSKSKIISQRAQLG
jgi:hypothetical protein